jgi:hypothetical protein
MQAMQMIMPRKGVVSDADRMKAVSRCQALLEKEGFIEFRATAIRAKEGAGSPIIRAAKGSRTVRVLILLEKEVDLEETREKLRDSHERGETRVYVPWPLRWRLLSNLERWGLDGIAVTGW